MGKEFALFPSPTSLQNLNNSFHGSLAFSARWSHLSSLVVSQLTNDSFSDFSASLAHETTHYKPPPHTHNHL